MKKPGPVSLISLLFLTAATVKSGTELGGSLAFAADSPREQLSICPPQPDELLKELELRENTIVVQEISISQRISALDQAQTELEAAQKALEQERAKLIDTYAVYEEAAAEDMKQLVTIYETMKPNSASEIFGAMDPKFAAGFVTRMQPEAAAAILATLAPAKAYEISSIVATQNASLKN